MSRLTKDRCLVADLPKTPPSDNPTFFLAGWVNSRRDHGGLVFVDLRDHSGLVQLVLSPDQPTVFEKNDQLSLESAIMVSGHLVARPPELVNDKIASGQVELVVLELTILNKAQPLPIPVAENSRVHEDNRWRYRYLDLRRPVCQNYLRQRAKFYQVIRDFMQQQNFVEVSTPILANSSPEGARDFLVPSRLQPGKFYALPQAPQQFKQLLMAGGLDRYYQIAPCFRDEDPRADRLYGDFYQLDLEMAFVDDGQFVRQTVAPLVELMVEDFAKKSLKKPLLELTYDQALADYGSDKPDLRFDLKLINLTAQLRLLKSDIIQKALSDNGLAKGLLVSEVFSRKQLDDYQVIAESAGLAGLGHLSLTSEGLVGPLAKLVTDDLLTAWHQEISWSPGQTLFFAVGQESPVNNALASLRNKLGQDLNLIDDSQVVATWITEFPFYEFNDQGQLDFAHNPFSKPLGDLTTASPASLRADQYDLVCNGYEVCSGAVRNHQPQDLLAAFSRVGYQKEQVLANFAGVLKALSYGAPPHAGCAFGLDRLLMILLETSNIRETVAFPKSGRGQDLLFDSPNWLSEAELAELGLSLKSFKKGS